MIQSILHTVVPFLILFIVVQVIQWWFMPNLSSSEPITDPYKKRPQKNTPAPQATRVTKTNYYEDLVQEEKKVAQDVSGDLEVPTGLYATCENTRVACDPKRKDCFLHAGYFDQSACLSEAQRIHEETERWNQTHKEKHPDVKFVSWHSAEHQNHPQCLILSERAEVVPSEPGWRTYVRDPGSYQPTSNPELFTTDGGCLCHKV